MGDFNTCIGIAVQEKRIPKYLAEEILESGDPAQYIKDTASRMAVEKRNKVVNAIVLARAMPHIDNHPKGPMAGLISLMARDAHELSDALNIDSLQTIYEKTFMKEFHEGAERFFPKFLGFKRDKRGEAEFARAIFGKASDDAEINDIAEKWLDLVERMRVTFNSLGGNISKLDSYYLPQKIDAEKLPEDADDFVSFLMDNNLLDRAKMVDDSGKVLDDDRLVEALKYVHQTMKTRGLNKAKDYPSMKGMGRSLSRKGSERRFLHFKDGDAWMMYNKQYGGADLYTTLTDHIQSMAGDMGLMQVFGTNPRATFQGLYNYAESQTAKKGLKLKKANHAKNLYKVISGEINGGDFAVTGAVMHSWRAFEGLGALGNVLFASVGDLFSASFAAHRMKIGGFRQTYKFMQNLMAQSTKKGGKEYRQHMAQIGFITDVMMGRAHSMNRFMDVYGTDFASKALETLLRGTGLEVWTQTIRSTFIMEFAGKLARDFGKEFDQLDNVDILKKHGITKAEWDAFRKTDLVDYNGALFADVTADPSMKFHQMILREVEFATPVKDAKSQAVMTQGTERNTPAGMAVRSIMQLKGYPIMFMLNHWQRALSMTTGDRTKYLGGLTTMMLAGSAVSMIASDFGKGKTPRDMDEKFWYEAFIRSGIGGPLADLFMTDFESYGKDLISGSAGLQASRVVELTDLTFGEIYRQLILGEDPQITKNLAKLAKDITPKPWQLNQIHDAVFYSLQELADPDHHKKFRTYERKMEEEKGQEYWFNPSDVEGSIEDIFE